MVSILSILDLAVIFLEKQVFSSLITREITNVHNGGYC